MKKTSPPHFIKTRWALVWICAIGTFLAVEKAANAKSGSFWETTSISVGVGSVLGASTLPFYDKPGSHLTNVALGAGIGAVTGIGIWAWNKIFKSSEPAPVSIILPPPAISVSSTHFWFPVYFRF